VNPARSIAPASRRGHLASLWVTFAAPLWVDRLRCRWGSSLGRIDNDNRRHRSRRRPRQRIPSSLAISPPGLGRHTGIPASRGSSAAPQQVAMVLGLHPFGDPPFRPRLDTSEVMARIRHGCWRLDDAARSAENGRSNLSVSIGGNCAVGERRIPVQNQSSADRATPFSAL